MYLSTLRLIYVSFLRINPTQLGQFVISTLTTYPVKRIIKENAYKVDLPHSEVWRKVDLLNNTGDKQVSQGSSIIYTFAVLRTGHQRNIHLNDVWTLYTFVHVQIRVLLYLNNAILTWIVQFIALPPFDRCHIASNTTVPVIRWLHRKRAWTCMKASTTPHLTPEKKSKRLGS